MISKASLVALGLVSVVSCADEVEHNNDESIVELGRHLFYDVRLSVNGTTSCASCHKQDLGFADGEPTSVGATGELGNRNSPGLANVASLTPLTWMAPNLRVLPEQIQVPMFGDNPIELGMAGHEDEIVATLLTDSLYQDLFRRSFPGDDEYDAGHVLTALVAFVATMLSDNSPYDQYVAGELSALTASQKRGLALFESERLGCSDCHAGVDLTTAVVGGVLENTFFNMGLYNVNGEGAYPTGNEGLFLSTFDEKDMGKVRVPSLRNVAVTGPYMHDGSVETLDDVLTIYQQGGRNVTEGPWAGDGRDNPNKADALTGFSLSAQERADLLHFFDALTDEEFLTSPNVASPWVE